MKLVGSIYLCMTCLLATQVVLADQNTTTGNTGSISASAKLDFNIAIGKYVMLRVGDANATLTTITMTVDLNPALGSGNSLAYSGAFPTSSPSTKFSKTVVSTNPSAGGVIPVAAFTNISGTTLSCLLTPLGATTPFNVGPTSVSGIPGTSQIFVTSAAGATNLQSPSPSLTGCTNGSTQTITLLTLMGGSFTYTANFAADTVAAGTYGNIVTYTATTP
jgi:hypothetical protein